ncbi:MAG: hypothetical protein QM734_05415 [Cyclobacteriaceae bacterium]
MKIELNSKNEMKKRMMNSWRVVGGILIISVVVLACQKDYGLENYSLTQAKAESVQTAHDNQQMIATMQEVAGVTASAFTNQGITTGRVADEGDDDELDCKAKVSRATLFTAVLPIVLFILELLRLTMAMERIVLIL